MRRKVIEKITKGPSSRYPKIRLDIKRYLIDLNLDLDNIYRVVSESRYSPSVYFLSYDSISEIERFTIFLEDRRFYRHFGLDIFCIPRLFRQLMSGRRVGAISTIDQQLVRTIVDRRERTISRKTKEILLSLLINARLSKRDILTSYLSIAYFGYGVKGADSASRIIFLKRLDQLSAQEAAFIASLLVYPLPKPVVRLFRSLADPGLDFDSRMKILSVVAPEWFIKISRRYKYALHRSGLSK